MNYNKLEKSGYEVKNWTKTNYFTLPIKLVLLPITLPIKLVLHLIQLRILKMLTLYESGDDPIAMWITHELILLIFWGSIMWLVILPSGILGNI
jgi:hypothetical protein